MATTTTQAAPNPMLKAYQDKVAAQVQEAKAKLEQLEAKAKKKKAQGEIAAINTMKTAKQNIDRKLQDLKATHDSNVARAKTEIDADVAKFKASIDELSGKSKPQTAKQ